MTLLSINYKLAFFVQLLQRHRLTVLLLAILLYGPVMGQTEDTLTEQTSVVQEAVHRGPRSFSQEKIEAYLENGDFDYPDRTKPVASLWSRFWRWLLSLFPDISIGAGWGPILRIALYILCGITIIYAVLRILGLDASQILGRRSGGKVEYAGDIEDIHAVDFEREINQSVAQQDYRSAIRWCYLWALKKLSDQQYINWQPGKTNHAYLAEVENRELRQRLFYLVYLYEYTWYGDFPADEALYRDTRQRIDRLNKPQPA